MLALLPTLSAIVLALAPAARQVVQAGPVGAIAVSRDGYVAMVDRDDALHIWHLASRSLVRTVPATVLAGDSGLAHPVLPAWDEATHEVVLVAGSGLVAVDVEGHVVRRAGDADRLWPVGGGGKARWIAARYGVVEVRDARGASLGKLDASEGIVASGDGKTAFVVGKAGLARWSLDPVAKLQTVPLPFEPDLSLSQASLAASGDGEIAAVCVKDGDRARVVLVSGLRGKPVVRTLDIPEPNVGCQVAIADEVGLVVVAAVGAMHAFDLATGAPRWHTGLDTSPDLTVGSDFAVLGRTAIVTNDGLQLFDLARGDAIGELGNRLAVPDALWFLRGDALLATRAERSSIFGPAVTGIARWALTDASATAGEAEWGLAFQIGEDGTLATVRKPAAADATESCFVFSRGSTADGAPVGAIAKGAWPPTPRHSAAVCLPPKATATGFDLERGAIVAYDTTGYVVVSPRGKPVRLVDAPRLQLAMTFSPDGAWIFASNARGSQFGILHAWDARTGARRWFTASATDSEGPSIGGDPRKGYVAHAASRDQIAVGAGDTVTVYALRDRNVVRTIAVPGPGQVSALAFAPGGGVIIGTDDGRVIGSHGVGASDGGAIHELRVRADGRRIATISDDGAVRIWDGRTAALAVTLIDFADGERFASTPGGAYRGGREAAERISWVFDGPTEGFSFEQFAAAFSRADVVTRRLADGKSDLAATIVRPPRVRLATPPPAQATSGVVRVIAHVEASTPSEVRAFVGGRLAASAPAPGASGDVALDIPLDHGLGAVTLVAFDAAGRSSNAVSFEVAAAPVATAPADVWVIAAGVGWYPDLLPEDQLEAPVNDARAIADVFAAQAGPGKLYAEAHVTLLEDEQVTPQALEHALAQLGAMKPNDLAVVFLAGHGVRLAGSNDMVFLTSTAKRDRATWRTDGIGWAKIGGALQQAKGRTLVLLDACHAGNVTQELIVPNSHLADDLVSAQRAGVLVFAASKGSQTSLEENAARNLVLDDEQRVLVKPKRVARPRPAPPPPPTPKSMPRERRGNGYFTGAFISALDTPSIDVNHDGLIEASEVIAQVRMRVTRASRGKQTPWVARREMFGDFVLTTAAK